ncbi:MAG: hypothetical protein QW821_06175 [Candidatus Bathyarchaeia archaeon]
MKKVSLILACLLLLSMASTILALTNRRSNTIVPLGDPIDNPHPEGDPINNPHPEGDPIDNPHPEGDPIDNNPHPE